MSHPHPELGPPPALPAGGLRVVALGGLGEVGRNMTVFEYAGRLLVVDCGVLFPEDFQPFRVRLVHHDRLEHYRRQAVPDSANHLPRSLRVVEGEFVVQRAG